MKKSMQFTYYAKIILNIFVYLLFFVYLIYFMLYGQIKNKAIWMVVCVIAGFMGLLYEVLKYLLDSGTKNLIFDGAPDECLKKINTLDKFDFLKTFRSTTIMMRLLADIDLREYSKLKEDIAKIDNEKDYIKTDYDVVLVKEYASMIMFGETKDKGKCKSAYMRLTQIRDTKTKKGKTRKGSYFFNWDVVNGTYECYDQKYESAYKKLVGIDTANMNKREAMHYYLILAISAKGNKLIDKANDCFEMANKLAGKNMVICKYISEIK